MERQNISNSNTVAEQAGKVAAVTLVFWILKVVTTTVGDLSGDLLSITLGLGYVTALIVALAATGTLLVAQFRARRFHHFLYWEGESGSESNSYELRYRRRGRIVGL